MSQDDTSIYDDLKALAVHRRNQRAEMAGAHIGRLNKMHRLVETRVKTLIRRFTVLIESTPPRQSSPRHDRQHGFNFDPPQYVALPPAPPASFAKRVLREITTFTQKILYAAFRWVRDPGR